MVEIIDELFNSVFGLSYHRGFKRPVVVHVVYLYLAFLIFVLHVALQWLFLYLLF